MDTIADLASHHAFQVRDYGIVKSELLSFELQYANSPSRTTPRTYVSYDAVWTCDVVRIREIRRTITIQGRGTRIRKAWTTVGERHGRPVWHLLY